MASITQPNEPMTSVGGWFMEGCFIWPAHYLWKDTHTHTLRPHTHSPKATERLKSLLLSHFKSAAKPSSYESISAALEIRLPICHIWTGRHRPHEHWDGI